MTGDNYKSLPWHKVSEAGWGMEELEGGGSEVSVRSCRQMKQETVQKIQVMFLLYRYFI